MFHKHLLDQVDLITILQEFIAENYHRIKLFWNEVCTVAQLHLLLHGSVHKFRHQNFRYLFFPHHQFESPTHPYLMM